MLGDDPYRADIHWRLGRVYARQQKLDEAVEQYRLTLALESKIPAHYFLAQALQVNQPALETAPAQSPVRAFHGVVTPGTASFSSSLRRVGRGAWLEAVGTPLVCRRLGACYTLTVNTKDFLRLGVPLGEATRRATDFISKFILGGGDKARLEEEVKAIIANPRASARCKRSI